MEGKVKKSIGAKTLVFPTPVLIVGTYDDEKRPNAMAVAWGGICCSQPPCVAVSLRKATYSYGNLLSRRAFTVNIPSESQVKEADYFGIASGREENKFEKTGLTPVASQLVDAPYVAEFSLVLECKVLHIIEIGRHTEFIGEILDIKADEAVLREDGVPDILKVKPIAYEPVNRRYFRIGSYLAEAHSVGRDLLDL
jgi:flavin reductase (DIM6/NTAB) family NADH-FMN oxidoreductase RutF